MPSPPTHTQDREKARIAAEEKRIRFEQSQQAASKDAVEEQKFESLRQGAERGLRDRQAVALEASGGGTILSLIYC